MIHRPRVALVTCATLPDLDPDDRLLVGPLRALGTDPVAAVWDDPSVDWESFDLSVLRSTWDYPARRGEFLAWAATAPRLANPADVIAWNTDKRYLLDLGSAGVPTMPTTWLSPGDDLELPNHGRFVLKPSVGAGSLDVKAFSMHHARERTLAYEHASRLLAAGQTVMVQPYAAAIEGLGETGLMFAGGKFSHAVSKAAMLAGERGLQAGGLYYQETITPGRPTDAQHEIAARALAAIPGGTDRLAYARVDLVPDADGKPLVMEVELTEPSLFMVHDASAAETFATRFVQLAREARN